MWHVFSHRGCPDGQGAAWACWKAKGRGGGFYNTAAYNEAPNFNFVNPKDIVYLLDFCFTYDEMKFLIEKKIVKQLVILDHHETREKDIKKIAKKYPDLVHNGYDVTKSGAMLAWEYFHPDTKAPKLIHHIQDRDLWQFQYKDTDAVLEALMSYPQEFETWNRLRYDDLLMEGEVLLRAKYRQIESLLRYAVQWRRIDGHLVPCMNTPVLTSDVAHAMLLKYPDAPFVAIYSDTADPKTGQLTRRWSLRSAADRKTDVSKICEKVFEGGGHVLAAGGRELL